MNMRNLGSEESIGIKFKNDIYGKFCLETTGIFVILLIQDGFASNCPETKFQSLSEASLKEQLSRSPLRNHG